MVKKWTALEFWFWRYDAKPDFNKIFDQIVGGVRKFSPWPASMLVCLTLKTTFSNVELHEESNGTKIDLIGILDLEI